MDLFRLDLIRRCRGDGVAGSLAPPHRSVGQRISRHGLALLNRLILHALQNHERQPGVRVQSSRSERRRAPHVARDGNERPGPVVP